MIASAPELLDSLTRAGAPIAALFGTVVGLMVWWTARNTQSYQNSKAEMDILQAASDTAVGDEKYRKFVDDLRKEKLANLAFRCQIPLRELGRLMSYYDRGFATAGEIGRAWIYRNAADKPLSFRLQGVDRLAFAFAMIYIVACLLFGAFLWVIALFLPTNVPVWQLVPSIACYFLFAALMTILARSLHAAFRLSRLERPAAADVS